MFHIEQYLFLILLIENKNIWYSNSEN